MVYLSAWFHTMCGARYATNLRESTDRITFPLKKSSSRILDGVSDPTNKLLLPIIELFIGRILKKIIDFGDFPREIGQ
jgi:hypothetical protein